jgi:hypothetical protein
MKNCDSKVEKKMNGKFYFSIKSIFILSSMFLVMSLVFNGCIGNYSPGGWRIHSHTLPETVKLSDYKVIQVKVISNLEKSEAECKKLEDKICKKLLEKKLFEKVVRGEEPQEAPVDLLLEAEITDFHKVTAMERLFADGFVGKAKFWVVSKLTDVKTGKELGTFTVKGDSIKGGGRVLIAAGTTKQARTHTVKAIIKFIKKHMK